MTEAGKVFSIAGEIQRRAGIKIVSSATLMGIKQDLDDGKDQEEIIQRYIDEHKDYKGVRL